MKIERDIVEKLPPTARRTQYEVRLNLEHRESGLVLGHVGCSVSREAGFTPGLNVRCCSLPAVMR